MTLPLTAATAAATLLAFSPLAHAQSLLRRPTPSAAPVLSPGVPAPASTPPTTTTPDSQPANTPQPPQPSSAPAVPASAPAAAPPPVSRNGQPNGPSGAMQSYSLLAVVPPPPHQYTKHEQVQIIINENTIQKHEQTLDTEKKENLSAKLAGFPSLRHLLEAQLKPGDSTLLDASLSSGNKFEGNGSYEHNDTFTTRITGTVLDVKPNGIVVLEARTTVMNNGQNYTILVAGSCRPEDITSNNTVQSSQLADLILKVESEGEVNDAGKKGWLTRFFDTVFNF